MTTVSLCKHSFPCQPPHGSIFRPGPCVGCGTTWQAAQDELARQEKALILGSARDGECPNCHQQRCLYRFQAPEQPWHDFDYEPPIVFLCADCWNDARDEENNLLAIALADATPTP